MTKPPYHHGDLANALVAAALAAVDAGGADAVSLRDLAQSLGVSRAAPYRHFADRDALLTAVAALGFEELAGIYESALAGPGDGRSRLRRAMSDYIDFADRRSGLHRLMFESDFLQRTPRPTVLVPPTDRTSGTLRRLMEGAYPEAGDAWLRTRTVVLLSTIVGFLVLDRVGRFTPYQVGAVTHEDLVEAVLDAAIGKGNPG
jgi:AcrR family transcriptional regulator